MRLLRRSPHPGKRSPTRIFFAADVHGSEPTFRKFLRAASFYNADALVFGGDLMGKALVPIVSENETHRARFLGVDHTIEGTVALAAFTRSVEVAGFYWKVMGRDEYEQLQLHPLLVTAMFRDLAARRLASWIELGEERLAGTGVRAYLTGGNDDDPAMLETLERHEGKHVIACEGRVVELDDEHTMITVGMSTPTPWDTPREASEQEIAAAIDGNIAEVPDVGRCVFNFHCPPKDTPIDTCLKLEKPPPDSVDRLPKPVRDGGRFVTTGGGSRAVRDAIERYQPLVGLHGHIHESAGRFRIGRTPCFNPGSEYLQGSLQGWIVQIRIGRVIGNQHTSG